MADHLSRFVGRTDRLFALVDSELHLDPRWNMTPVRGHDYGAVDEAQAWILSVLLK